MLYEVITVGLFAEPVGNVGFEEAFRGQQGDRFVDCGLQGGVVKRHGDAELFRFALVLEGLDKLIRVGGEVAVRNSYNFV